MTSSLNTVQRTVSEYLPDGWPDGLKTGDGE